MKKVVFCASVAVALACIWACNGKKTADVVPADVADADEEVVPDSTVYGRCGDGTAMHTLELITDQGDTLQLLVNDDDSITSCIKGGLFVGDRLAVIVGRDAEAEMPRAEQVVNLTTLLGKWVSLDKNFELQEGGVVVSTVKEPKPYTEWKICNGRLVLSADTFTVYELGGDSLFLENEHGIYSYKRLK